MNNCLETIRDAFVLFVPHTFLCVTLDEREGVGRKRREGRKSPLNVSFSISIRLFNNTENVGRISSVELLSMLSENKHIYTGN